MSLLNRADTSLLAQWWRDIDHHLLGLMLALIVLGLLFTAGSFAPLQERYNGPVAMSLMLRHGLFLTASLAVMLLVSRLSPVHLLKLSTLLMVLALIACAAAIVTGPPINNAQRWLRWGGLSIQPSELFKPCFAIVCARLFSGWRLSQSTLGCLLATLLMLTAVGILLLQPDVGQSLLVIFIWFGQFFLSGLPLLFVVAIIILVGMGFLLIYATTPYVRDRIQGFLNPQSSDTFQVDAARRAIDNGDWFGQGLGSGIRKFLIPDAHSDFIFAVGVEEMGTVIGLVILGLYLSIGLLVVRRLLLTYSLFVVIAGLGLILLLLVQAWINLASTLALIPTKGMTLPFVSMGGSSLLTMGFTAGCLLALTRHSARLAD